MLSKLELKTIASVIKTLDHYQILKISPHASSAEISEAYHREALNLHPDLYEGSQDKELVSLSKDIFSKVVEAYRTLSSKERRIHYDKLKGFNHQAQASDESENIITSVTHKTKSPAASAGLRFFKLAQTAFQAKDFQSARMNAQIALNTDPNNPEFLALAERIENEIKK